MVLLSIFHSLLKFSTLCYFLDYIKHSYSKVNSGFPVGLFCYYSSCLPMGQVILFHVRCCVWTTVWKLWSLQWCYIFQGRFTFASGKQLGKLTIWNQLNPRVNEVIRGWVSVPVKTSLILRQTSSQGIGLQGPKSWPTDYQENPSSWAGSNPQFLFC